MTAEKHMIKIKQAIIVEGKYDKNKLSSLVDAMIITTDGFGLYKDKEKAALIRALAKKTGIVILTDSDSAGFKIRSRIKSIAGGGEIINAYIPDIYGKERRKTAPSKEGKLGVEGMSAEVLLEVFRKAGITAQRGEKKNSPPVTKSDLLDMGLCGGENSSVKRAALQKKLGLPERLSANGLLEIINVMYTRDEFLDIVNSE